MIPGGVHPLLERGKGGGSFFVWGGCFQKQVFGPFLFLNTSPLRPQVRKISRESTKIDQNRPKSIKIHQKRSKLTKKDQNQAPNPLPLILRELCARFMPRAGKGRATYGAKMEKAPSPNVPKLRRTRFFVVFFLGGGEGAQSIFCIHRGERAVPYPPLAEKRQRPKMSSPPPLPAEESAFPIDCLAM